jgi:diguanylate cyclase (GGDEF)-like protein/PAS domain S-box-containing protein
MKKSLRKQPIQRKLFFSFSILLLLVIALMYGSISYILYRDQIKNIERNLINTTNSVIELVESAANLTIKNHLEKEVSEAKTIVEVLNEQGLEENKSTDEIKEQVSQFLLRRKIGETGYIYVIDSQGFFRVHPFKELIGTSAEEYEFIQTQIKEKSGYLEYLWQNPGDPEPREKALYMSYYKPWDWIISASAYRNEFSTLININSIKESIGGINSERGGEIFILDSKGQMLMDNGEKGKVYKWEKSFLDQLVRERNGEIKYKGKELQSGEMVNHMVMFRYLPYHDWIIAVSLSLDEYTRIFYVVLWLLGVIFLASFFLFLGIGLYVTRLLTTPLNSIVKFINEISYDDLSKRLPITDQSEFSHLSQQINIFLDTIETEQNDRMIAQEENRILAQFTNGNPYPVMRIDKNGQILYVNKAGKELMRFWNIVLSTRIPLSLNRQIENSSRDIGDIEYEYQDRTYHIMFSYFESQDSYYLLIMDITEKKENEVLLIMSESVFFHTTEGIIITDPKGTILRINPAVTKIYGYSEDDLLGENPRILKSLQHGSDFYKRMWTSLNETGSWSGEIWNRRKNNEIFPEWLSINGVYDEKRNLIHYVAVFKDISELKESEEKLRHQVSHDALTGLPNRVLFEDRLQQAIARAERKGVTLAVLFLDMDNFKHINDSLGHQVGDSFLKVIAGRLQEACRDEDTVARLGGDEFVILLTEYSERINVVEVTRRLLEILGAPLTLENHNMNPAASIGITVFPEDGKDAQGLMKNADLAMYKAKAMGKGTYSLFNQDMNDQVKKRMELESRLLNSLLNEEISLVYQPKITVQNRQVMGVEALVRWNSPDIGFISPLDFIPLAEETGFIMPLGDWILEKALSDLKEIHDLSGNAIDMAVNLSVRQFWDKELILRIEKIVNASQINPAFISLEITENMAMEDSEVALDIMDKLINLGTTLSIDDFGTGYSSYSYLKRFQAKSLKIDKSFVDELPHEKKTSAIMENLIDLGHTLGMEVVAEGVEDKAQYDFLNKTGCDIIQGYYFSKPLLKNELINYLKAGV